MGLSAYASEKEVAAYLDGLECPQARRAPIAPDFVRSLFEAIDSRRWPSLEDFFSKDIIYERPGYAPLIGYDRVLKFYRETRVIASGRHLLEEIVVDGDGGACWGRFVGEHKNGSQIDEGFADTYKFENGRIKVRKSYFFRPAV
jgi:ketosteroid isomerase-like protein